MDGLVRHSRFVHKMLIDYLGKYEVGTGLIMDQRISSLAESPRSARKFPEVVKKRRHKASSTSIALQQWICQNSKRGWVDQRVAPNSRSSMINKALSLVSLNVRALGKGRGMRKHRTIEP